MTPRSFFAILLKIMGLYLVLASFTVVPELISTVFMFRNPNGDDWGMFAVTLGIWLMAFGLFYITLKYCLFKTDWLIDKLRLDQHFTEEKFDINIHRSTVLSIAVIVIGCLLFIESVPALCRQAYNYFASRPFLVNTRQGSNFGWVVFYGVKTFIGYWVMTNSRLIVNLIERERKKQA